MKTLAILFAITVIHVKYMNCLTTEIPKVDPFSTSTGTGSYFEYVVRSVLRHPFDYPRIEGAQNIPDVMQMIYYYHLQMTHIDMMWLRNWQRSHHRGFPSLFELPSRAVHYHYNFDVPYDFGDGIERTLDSHRLNCTECIRQFHCNVHHLGNHKASRFLPNPEPKYERRTTIPDREIALENEQQNWLPQMTSTNDAPSPRELGAMGGFTCAVAPVTYNYNGLGKKKTTTTTTPDPFEPELKRFKYEVVHFHDELRRRKRMSGR